MILHYVIEDKHEVAIDRRETLQFLPELKTSFVKLGVVISSCQSRNPS